MWVQDPAGAGAKAPLGHVQYALKSQLEAPHALDGRPRVPYGSWAVMTMLYKEFTSSELG